MKRILGLLLAIVLVAGVAACGGAATPEPTPAPAPESTPAPTPEPTPTPEPEEPAVPEAPENPDTAWPTLEGREIRIAFMFKDSTSPFWRYMWAGAIEAAEKYGVEVVEFSPIQAQNHEEQARQMEDAIMQGFDAIMLAAVDTTAIIPFIEQAVDAGIPVITANTRVPDSPVETFIGLDNYDGALILSRAMMEKIGGEGTVIIVDGNPASGTSQLRNQGLHDGAEDYPDVEIIVTAPGYFQRANAMELMENMIQAVPKIDAVMAMNDEMALGSLQALRAAGLEEDVLISGFDGALEGLEAIRDGLMAFSLDQDPISLGYWSVVYAMDVLEAHANGAALGGNILPEWIIEGGHLMSIDNAAEAIQRFRDHGF